MKVLGLKFGLALHIWLVIGSLARMCLTSLCYHANGMSHEPCNAFRTTRFFY